MPAPRIVRDLQKDCKALLHSRYSCFQANCTAFCVRSDLNAQEFGSNLV